MTWHADPRRRTPHAPWHTNDFDRDGQHALVLRAIDAANITQVATVLMCSLPDAQELRDFGPDTPLGPGDLDALNALLPEQEDKAA